MGASRLIEGSAFDETVAECFLTDPTLCIDGVRVLPSDLTRIRRIGPQHGELICKRATVAAVASAVACVAATWPAAVLTCLWS